MKRAGSFKEQLSLFQNGSVLFEKKQLLWRWFLWRCIVERNAWIDHVDSKFKLKRLKTAQNQIISYYLCAYNNVTNVTKPPLHHSNHNWISIQTKKNAIQPRFSHSIQCPCCFHAKRDILHISNNNEPYGNTWERQKCTILCANCLIVTM